MRVVCFVVVVNGVIIGVKLGDVKAARKWWLVCRVWPPEDGEQRAVYRAL